MKQMTTGILILLFMITNACTTSERKKINFVLAPGDFWIEDFSSGNFPGKAYHDDKVYCTSINSRSSKLKNYCYCLNLRTGKVDWRHEIENYASRPPLVIDSTIYLVTYTGFIHCLSVNGEMKWHKRLGGAYSSHCINPHNNNLFVSTVSNGVFEYEYASGSEIRHYGDTTLGVTLPIIVDSLFIYAQQDKASQEKFRSQIICSTLSGDTVWSELFGEIDQIYYFQNRLFFVDDNNLNCIDLLTGKTLWTRKNIRNWEERIGFMKNIVFLDNRIDQNAFSIINGKPLHQQAPSISKTYYTNHSKSNYEINCVIDFFSTYMECELEVQ